MAGELDVTCRPKPTVRADKAVPAAQGRLRPDVMASIGLIPSGLAAAQYRAGTAAANCPKTIQASEAIAGAFYTDQRLVVNNTAPTICADVLALYNAGSG